MHFAEVRPIFAEQRYEKGLFLPKKVAYTLDTFVYYHMIFVSPFFSPVVDSEFVECTSEVGHFVDGQPVLDLVELVDVDQKEAAQASFGILFTLEVDAVRIAEAQFRW